MPLPILGRTKRAPRVNIPTRESALIDVGGREFRAGLCKLSIRGGCLTTKPMPFGKLAGITLHTTSGKVDLAIQFLHRDASGRHGFRFLQIDPVNLRRLETTVDELRRQGLADGSYSVIELCTNTARRVMRKAKEIGRA